MFCPFDHVDVNDDDVKRQIKYFSEKPTKKIHANLKCVNEHSYLLNLNREQNGEFQEDSRKIAKTKYAYTVHRAPSSTSHHLNHQQAPQKIKI